MQWGSSWGEREENGGITGAGFEGAPGALGGNQDQALFHLDCCPSKAAAVPGPAWPHPPVPWGESGGPPLGRETSDPYPEPQELAAARAALGDRDPRELLWQDEEGDT